MWEIATPFIWMLKTSLSMDSSTSAALILIDSNKIDNGIITLMLRMNSFKDSSTSATEITVEYNEVHGDGGKLVKKSSKIRKIVKKSKKPQRPEKFTKTISLEEPSFLTSDIKLAIIKMSSSGIHNNKLSTIIKPFENWKPY